MFVIFQSIWKGFQIVLSVRVKSKLNFTKTWFILKYIFFCFTKVFFKILHQFRVFEQIVYLCSSCRVTYILRKPIFEWWVFKNGQFWDIFHNNKIPSMVNVIIVGSQIVKQSVEVWIWVLFDKIVLGTIAFCKRFLLKKERKILFHS